MLCSDDSAHPLRQADPVSDARPIDVIVIGGGLIGLATALKLLERKPDLHVLVVEKEDGVASHQSGHNSGVLHAGLYYAPGSLKARLCREGKAEVERFAAAHGIPHEPCGKLVVAISENELPLLEALRERATANGVPQLEMVEQARIREIEPHAVGLRALWSPTTGIIDFRRVAFAIADEVRDRGSRVLVNRRVLGIERRSREVVLRTSAGDLVTRNVIACAGLYADRVSAMSGDSGPERIVPFRGGYYRLTADARALVRGLIYPVPDPRFPFLGIHFTKRIDGEVWAGPNAVLAFAREGYGRFQLNPREFAATIANRSFLRLAARYWRMGAIEYWRDWSRRRFTHDLQRYIPELRKEQLEFGPSGVRAQSLDPDGSLVDDFRLSDGDRILHVRNAPSPGATASLAIGRELADRAIRRFEFSAKSRERPERQDRQT
jgi:L-2-hydroxyglutarate oxidase